MAITCFSEFRELERSVSWFRGISELQKNACNDLLYALRDDIEQGSTYRVRKCLLLLGLKPILTSKKIRLIMGVSSGNDLAFLWFIWEAYYKKPRKGTDEYYTVNEQLILTAIAHLDMASTMRALDLILPSAVHSKKQQDMLRQRDAKLALKNVKEKLQTRPKPQKSELPYLVPQLRPKSYRSKSEILRPKDRKVNFPSYDQYRDKMYQIPNESSRWFATYQISPAKREVKACISKALDLVFADNRDQVDKTFCNFHQMLDDSAARKQQELADEAMQRCMMMLDIQGSEQLRKRKHILDELESAVKCAAWKLRLFKEQQIMLLNPNKTGDSKVDCQMCMKMQKTTPLNSYGDDPDQKGDFTILFNSEYAIHRDSDEDQPVTVLEVGKEHVVKRVSVNKRKCQSGYPRYKGKTPYCAGMYSAGENKTCSQNNPIMDGKIKILNSNGQVAISSPKTPLLSPQPSISAESVFKFCSTYNMGGGIPQWDYFKIFEPSAQLPADDQLHDREQEIRSYCIAALNRAMELPHNHISEKDVHKKQHKQFVGINSQATTEAAEQCAMGMIKKAVKSAQITPVNKTDENGIDIFQQYTDIDPEDTQTLLKLLKMAIDILKSNPHYVLVTLPNAHRLPILLDWIAERYGKTYNARQLAELAKSTSDVYNILNKNFSKIDQFPLPSAKQYLGSHTQKSKEFICSIQQMKNSYNSKLIKVTLDEMRLTWFALRCYSNLTGVQEKTVYAYMPTCEQDILCNSVWKSYEYRNMILARQQER